MLQIFCKQNSKCSAKKIQMFTLQRSIRTRRRLTTGRTSSSGSFWAWLPIWATLYTHQDHTHQVSRDSTVGPNLSLKSTHAALLIEQKKFLFSVKCPQWNILGGLFYSAVEMLFYFILELVRHTYLQTSRYVGFEAGRPSWGGWLHPRALQVHFIWNLVKSIYLIQTK